MERAIEEKKNKLRGDEAQQRRSPNEAHEPFGRNGESLAEQSDHLDDEDLEYINNILNSCSRPVYNHEGPNNLKLKSFSQEDTLASAFASRETMPEFNLKFNQKSTTRGSEEDHFSYFSNI